VAITSKLEPSRFRLAMTVFIRCNSRLCMLTSYNYPTTIDRRIFEVISLSPFDIFQVICVFALVRIGGKVISAAVEHRIMDMVSASAVTMVNPNYVSGKLKGFLCLQRFRSDCFLCMRLKSLRNKTGEILSTSDPKMYTVELNRTAGTIIHETRMIDKVRARVQEKIT
jgi:hypothetical protein